MSGIKAFNTWETDGIKVDDPGIKRYVTLAPRFVPKTGARYVGSRFHKSKVFIVERIINKLMIPGHKGKKHWRSSGHCCGKKQQAYEVVFNAFKIIEGRTKKNPIMVFVKAIENSAPREGIITIEYGGARYPKAIECSPQRRIDLALRFFVQGAYAKCFNSKRKLETALAEEIINAYNLNAASMAIAKKYEVERQADSSR